MRRLMLVLIMLILAAVQLLAIDVTIRRPRTYLRKGAASFHPILAEIPTGTKVNLISQEGSWLKVKYRTHTGFIAESATQDQKARNDVFAGMSKSTTGSQGVSQHSISAGVKGFGERFNTQLKGDTDFMDYVLNEQLDFQAFIDFQESTYKSYAASQYQALWRLPRRIEPDYYTEAQEGFGLAVASVLAKMGVYKNPNLDKYIASVGNLVVAASDVPDIGFRFFVLDIPQPNAYACPGGIVFITKGMLQNLQNEAELAFVLAHEIAHISKFHGIAEAEKRKHHIAAESAFDELDFETQDAFSDKGKEVEQELEQEIFKMFESLIQGRLDQYEREADYFAIMYMARAGYEPQASITLLNRLSRSGLESNNQHYRSQSIRERIGWVSRFSSEYSTRRLRYFYNGERYLSNAKYFREAPVQRRDSNTFQRQN